LHDCAYTPRCAVIPDRKYVTEFFIWDICIWEEGGGRGKGGGGGRRELEVGGWREGGEGKRREGGEGGRGRKEEGG
jgi:hypothetical protein